MGIARTPTWAFVALVLIGLLAVIVGGSVVADGLRALGQTQRLVMPGSVRTHLGEPGEYTLFYEYRSVVDGTRFDTQRPLNMRLAVTDLAGGREVPLTSTEASRYSLGDYAGSSLVTFRVERAGDYDVRASYASGQAGPPFVLALTPASPTGLGLTIVAGVVVWFGFSAIVASVVLLMLRRRNRAAALK